MVSVSSSQEEVYRMKYADLSNIVSYLPVCKGTCVLGQPVWKLAAQPLYKQAC